MLMATSLRLALRLRGRKRTGSLSQFKRRHSFSVGGGGGGGGSSDGGNGGNGSNGSTAASKRWWKSTASSAYELDVPSTGPDAGRASAGVVGTSFPPHAPSQVPAPTSTPISPRSFFSGGGGGRVSTRHTQQTLEGLYLVLLGAGESLQSVCEAAKLDGPAERV